MNTSKFDLPVNGFSQRATSTARRTLSAAPKSVQVGGEGPSVTARPQTVTIQKGNGRTEQMPIQKSVSPVKLNEKKV